jgi:hypothetical protein
LAAGGEVGQLLVEAQGLEPRLEDRLLLGLAGGVAAAGGLLEQVDELGGRREVLALAVHGVDLGIEHRDLPGDLALEVGEGGRRLGGRRRGDATGGAALAGVGQALAHLGAEHRHLLVADGPPRAGVLQHRLDHRIRQRGGRALHLLARREAGAGGGEGGRARERLRDQSVESGGGVRDGACGFGGSGGGGRAAGLRSGRGGREGRCEQQR